MADRPVGLGSLVDQRIDAFVGAAPPESIGQRRVRLERVWLARRKLHEETFGLPPRSAQMDVTSEVRKSPPHPVPSVEDVAALVVERLRERTSTVAESRPATSISSSAPVLTLVPTGRAEILTLEQVAELLQVSHPTVRRAVREQGLPCTLVGKQYRFRRADVDRWMERRKAQAHGRRPA